MDALHTYICTVYAVVLLACAIGAFNRHYDANLLQRLALSMFALWAVWRIRLVYSHSWGYPHEPLVATALLLYAIGSGFKTLKYWRRRSRQRQALQRAGCPMRRKEDAYGLL